jgi:16S rRNA (cytosine967-C5)-methyltransferase
MKVCLWQPELCLGFNSGDLYPPIRRALLDSLPSVFVEGVYVDQEVERAHKTHRQWGSRDRRVFAETLFDCSRHIRLLVLESGQRWSGDWSAIDFEKVLDSYLQIHTSDGGLEISAQLKAAYAPAEYLSWPDELFDRIKTERPDDFLPLTESLNERADVFLRCNRLKADSKAVLNILKDEDVVASTVDGVQDALRLAERKNVFRLKSFLSGFYEVQDAGSQKVGQFLGVEPGMRVVDACAGAGGKTLQLAALMKNQGKIVALDVVERKLTNLKERSRRAGVDICETKLIDSTKVIKRLADSADRLLLDVPCSGLGVVRRKPDTKWRVQLADIENVRAIQSSILKDYTKMVKVGGIVVYATCSILPSENQQQVQSFLRENTNFALLAEAEVLPQTTGFDGFYMARLRRLS